MVEVKMIMGDEAKGLFAAGVLGDYSVLLRFMEPGSFSCNLKARRGKDTSVRMRTGHSINTGQLFPIHLIWLTLIASNRSQARTVTLHSIAA